ncbi:hypothetical protein [Owenweeksia hongkongensis]|uniref:hypothetical protein n=1 Tax=Owenweeksia hongkongensis TaxID=253245 RepID=UPI003A8DBA2A
MRIIEAIDMMSSAYLERVIKSFTKEYPKKDENGYRDEIINNVETLKDDLAVENRFNEAFIQTGNPYSNKILAQFILKALLAKEDNCATENEIIAFTEAEEKKVIESASGSEVLKHLPQNSETIFTAVLDAALDDSSISKDEMSLLIKLREKLQINDRDQQIILAKLKHFPKQDNAPHTFSEITKSINDLQKCGLIFYCNQPGNGQDKFLVIPEEISPALKKLMGIELMEDKFALLLANLTMEQLKVIVKSKNLMTSGAKDVLIERTITAGIKPSQALNLLSIGELQDLALKCKGLKKSGTKPNKIAEIISFYDNLITRDTTSVSEDPNETFYQYFEQLAARDEKNLLNLNIISKAKDIDNAFEYATRFMFEHKFGHTLLHQTDSDHCDGCIEFLNNGELFMWDNKSLMQGSSYTFPDPHLTQFKRYIKDARDRNNKKVRCFLIITSEVAEDAELNAYKLKMDSGADTDISIIVASDLVEIAENWKKSAKDASAPFNLEIFNYTGILDRETLKKRMKIFN